MIIITLANDAEFGIDNENDMFIGRISEPMSRVYLGKADVLNFDRLLENMKHLGIHMTDRRLDEDRP